MQPTGKDAKHKAAMQKQKASVDASIAAADLERGVAILLTGDGKGKSSSAFGMVMRALGYPGSQRRYCRRRAHLGGCQTDVAGPDFRPGGAG